MNVSNPCQLCLRLEKFITLIVHVCVLGFRSIGKGISAAEKCLSFLDLNKPVYTWHEHTNVISLKAQELAEKNCKDAVLELKKIKRQVGEVKNCTDKKLEDKIVDAGSSFDCSWSSKVWSARDSVIAAVSEDTGRVPHVVHLTSSCPQCTKMGEKQASGEISKIAFLEWYIGHEKNCLLNHEGSAQVI